MLRMAPAVAVPRFNPHVQIVESLGSRGIDQDHGMAPGLEADIRRLGNQHQQIHHLGQCTNRPDQQADRAGSKPRIECTAIAELGVQNLNPGDP